MDWNTIYPGPEPPTEAELAAYVETPLWTELVHYLSQAYHTDPVCTYSTCSMGRGWNVKYRAGGAALCTLYPGAGAFVCLIVAGCRLASAVEQRLPTLSPGTQRLWKETRPMSNGVRWLALEVGSSEVLEDVKALLALKRKPNRTR